MAWKAVMTNSGIELLKGMLGGARLSITHASIGSDISSDEEIRNLKDLSNKIPAYVQAVKLSDKSCETVQVRISNLGVTEPAVMHQVGLYAKIDDGLNVLLVVYQNDFGEEIPTYVEYPNLSLKFNAGLDISITDNIVVMVNHGAFITFDDLEAHNSDPKAHADIINGIVDKISQKSDFKKHIITTRTRDPSKPDYGINETEPDAPGAEAAVLKIGTYTGAAETSVIINGVEYDALNLSQSGEQVPDGNITFKMEE